MMAGLNLWVAPIMRKKQNLAAETNPHEGEPKTLAGRVLQRRLQLGLNQEELAKKAGVSQQTINKIEGGRIKQPRKIKAIADALQESPAWLQFGAREIDNLDKDVVLAAVALQELPAETRKIIIHLISNTSRYEQNKP